MVSLRTNTIDYYTNYLYEDKNKMKCLKETKEKMGYQDEYIQSKIKQVDILDMDTHISTSDILTKEQRFQQESINKYKHQVHMGKMIQISKF